MARKPQSIDGFTLQRRDVASSAKPTRVSLDKVNTPKLHTTHVKAPTTRRVAAKTEKRVTPGDSQVDLLQSDVMESLQGIDDIDQPPEQSRRARKKAKKAEKNNDKKKKKWIKWTIIGVIAAVLIVGGYFAWKVFANMGKIFKGNPIAAITSNQRLKADANGRTNILVFGDESGSQAHIDNGAGTEATDSIMVISLNQDTNDAALYSIPRDLWVNMPEGCSVGNQAKINAVYLCGMELNNGDERKAADILRQTVGEYMAQDVQYYAKANFTLVQEAVDAVGGITVNIESTNPNGILDRNFDWECNYQCNYVKYPNGPATMDGKHALALARARNAQGGYGLDRGNFDREVNQQKIAIAIKEKAVSAGTISNPIKVSQLLDAFGNNLVTNIEAGEVQSLAKLVQKIDTANIKKISFVDEAEPMMTTGNASGQSIVQPIAGLYDFSQVQAYLARQLSSDPVVKEGATIGVYNGSGVSGAAAKVAGELAAKGFLATADGNAPETAGTYAIYDLSAGAKPGTSAKLASTYGVNVTAATAADLPEGVQSGTDFVIIVGSNGAN